MPLDPKLKKDLLKALECVDDQGTRGPRLADEARRLFGRIRRLVSLDLIADPDLDALELSCFALLLPMRQPKSPGAGKLPRTNVRERTEQAAELLVSLFSDRADDKAVEALLDRATRLLHETSHRSPVIEDARLLADAVNLEDFGVVGLIRQMVPLIRQGDGIEQLADGCAKREQYGYWEARLKDGFHFEPVRQIAKRHLARARQVASLLLDELKEDQPE